MRSLLIIEQESWHDEMYNQKCVCGHELYKHAFTMGAYTKDSVDLYVSQCCFCDYDKETEKFPCETFRKP